MTYKADDYWEKRLADGFNLSKVGDHRFSVKYNKFLYKSKVRAINKALSSHRINLLDSTICDIGVGTGFWVDFYKFHGARSITGVDITDVSVKRNKQKYPEYNFIKADISSSSFLAENNNKFDILNVFDVLYHIKEEKLFNRAISNICQLTRENGYIFISDAFQSDNIDVAEHVEFRSRKNYETILNENNSKIISIYPIYYLLFHPQKRINRIALDDILAPIYYYLDNFFMSLEKSKLNLMIIKKLS
jgi:2-polyprenyl-3-methyl-5-hydroxy-6-metoxy-1,4-benzoquinol methylase